MALDHHVFAIGRSGVEKARAAEMLDHVDGNDKVGVAFAGIAEMFGPHADDDRCCPLRARRRSAAA